MVGSEIPETEGVDYSTMEQPPAPDTHRQERIIAFFLNKLDPLNQKKSDEITEYDRSIFMEKVHMGLISESDFTNFVKSIEPNLNPDHAYQGIDPVYLENLRNYPNFKQA